MEESCSRQSGNRDCGSLLLCERKSRGGSRFIVVFQKAQQLPLVGQVSAKMKPDAFRIFMLQPIIKPLVVAEIEAMLLQFPLLVPVSLGNEADVRMRSLNGGDHVIPVFGRRSLPSSAAPRALENLIQQKHGHVATDAITLSHNI